ncbi:MAG: hypothetical protein ABIR06_14390 [Cyclobacteriaceae bacterium]
MESFAARIGDLNPANVSKSMTNSTRVSENAFNLNFAGLGESSFGSCSEVIRKEAPQETLETFQE